MQRDEIMIDALSDLRSARVIIYENLHLQILF
jgi:hypothetical protein